MKAVLIIPPIYYPCVYHIAVPLLAGQLQAENIETLCIDANIGLFNFILNAQNAEKQKENIITNSSIIKDFGRYINLAVNLTRDKNEFYSIKSLEKSFKLLDLLFEAYCRKFPDFKWSFYPKNRNMDSKWHSFEYLDKNIDSEFFFDEYYRELIKKIELEKPDLIGISFSYLEQIIPGLKAAYLLKKSLNSKIVFGGNHISRIIDELPNKEILFRRYCDFFIKDDGERALVELCSYLDNKIPIDDVSNLIYFKDGRLISNYQKRVSAKLVKPVNLNGFNFKDYFIPEIVSPVKLSRGCYYNKCAFCSHAPDVFYSVRDMNSIIDEIKYHVSLGISKFYITDESTSPNLLERFADALMRNNLDIKYMIYARFEKEFNKKLLEKAYKSGLRMVLWGFETASRRIHKLMNKGDAFEKRYEILKNAYDCGIFNHLFIFHGFPSSKLDDEMKTLEFIDKNSKILGSFPAHIYFTLDKGSIIEQNLDKFGITELKHINASDFRFKNYAFDGNVLSSFDAEKINEAEERIIRSKYNSNFAALLDRELMFLYVCHYGAKNIKKFISNDIKK